MPGGAIAPGPGELHHQPPPATTKSGQQPPLRQFAPATAVHHLRPAYIDDVLDQEGQREKLWSDCRRQSNMAGLQGGVAMGLGCLAANFVLQRTSRTYRNKFEFTGKALLSAVLVYGAYYNTSFISSKRCFKRSGLIEVSQNVILPQKKYGPP